MIQTQQQAMVDEAITSRRSIRAYLPQAVAREDIEAILEVAARAPSGTNTQPWKVYVLTGAARDGLSTAIVDAYLDPERAAQHAEEYSYYPTKSRQACASPGWAIPAYVMKSAFSAMTMTAPPPAAISSMSMSTATPSGPRRWTKGCGASSRA